MKKLIIVPVLLLLLIPVILLTGQDFSLSVRGLTLAKTGPAEYSASFTVKYSGLSESMTGGITVPVPAERFYVCGQVDDGTIGEEDFLFAGMGLDLNGDGDTADSFRLTKVKRVSYLGDAPLKIILSPYAFNGMDIYDYSGSAEGGRMTKLSPSGTPLLVYSLDEKNGTACVGIGTAAEPLVIGNEKNPCVRVEIIKPADSRNTLPAFQVAGAAKRITFTNEKLFEGSDSWNASAWAVLPVEISGRGETNFTVKLNSVTPPFAVRVTAYAAIDSGIALASKPAVKIQR